MTTVVEKGDSASGAVALIVALLVLVVVGFAIYAFSTGKIGGPTNSVNIQAPAPSVPAAPSVPSGQ